MKYKYETKTTRPPAPRAAKAKQYQKRENGVGAALERLKSGQASFVQSEKLTPKQQENVRACYYVTAKKLGMKVQTYISKDNRVIAVVKD
jgi:hypothetical protein